MAAKHRYRQGILLLLFHFFFAAALERRFSDFKRCADEECSMLLCRGKAVQDFSGPDCRFLSFKKSETIYVYYKLSGKRTDMFAGSVGSHFGYFPKDLLAVNHIYTDKEVEIPAEETDFVCFDTGFDKFDNYDIDLLLGSSQEQKKGTSDHVQETDNTQRETQPSEEVTSSEKQTEHDDNLDDQSASLHVPLDTSTESPPTKAHESGAAVTLDDTERAAEEVNEKHTVDSDLENVSNGSETKDTPTKSEVEPENEPISKSEGVQIPEIKTTLGTTFDAVATDDEITKSVTPYDEDENSNEEYYPEDDGDVNKEIPLLASSEETISTPESDSLKVTESPPATQEDEPKAPEDNMWKSIGDVMFSVVTGGERTSPDFSSDEDEDDEDLEEEARSQSTQGFEKVKTEEPQSVESPKDPENVEPIVQDFQEPPQSRSIQEDSKESVNDHEKLLFDHDEEEDVAMGQEEDSVEILKPSDEPVYHQTEHRLILDDHVMQEDTLGSTDTGNLDIKTAKEPTEDKKDEFRSKDLEITEDNAEKQDSSVVPRQDADETVTEKALGLAKSEKDKIVPSDERQSNDSDVKHDENAADNSLPGEILAHSETDLESNTSQEELSLEEQEPTEENEGESDDKKEELLEDENALSFSDSNADNPSPVMAQSSAETPDPEYSEDILRLTILRDHFSEDSMQRVQRVLGLKNLFKIEAMFADLDTELRSTRLFNSDATQDVESALENILETSENAILDEIEKMLDNHHLNHNYDYPPENLDEETQILDDFQELAFGLRQKYSTASDSTPLAAEESLINVPDEHDLNVTEDTQQINENIFENTPEMDDNLTVAGHQEQPTEIKEEQITMDEVPARQEVSVEEDGGHFNKNKEDQPGFSTSDDMQKVPQATLENPLDMGLGVEVDHSGSMDSMEPVPEIHEEEDQVGSFSVGIVYTGCILSMLKNKTVEWTTVMISLLPEEWKPGETLFGCPWQVVVITALVGVVTFTLFFWRTVLAVKTREYLVDEKKLTEQMQALRKEKNDALAKMSELQKQSEHLKEHQKQSKETISSTKKRMQELESKVSKAETLNEKMAEEKKKYAKLLEEERANAHQNETRIAKLEKSNEKLQLSRKKIQEALAKTTVLLDESKIREDARNVQHKCQEKDFAVLKEENKTLKTTIKGWEEKHKELNEKIKVYQKSQKELEDSVVLKDHNVEVLSELLADLDACDFQKGDAKVLANGEVTPDKNTAIKNRIKQMMDVSRVQTTLTVVEEERDRFMTKLLNEEKTRKTLEEQHQELEHAIATLKGEKSHVENQFKILQQKNEIMVEMYQQKENALQQRLTKEELERRSKENLLSEVGGKALEAEEQVKVLRQRINEMEEQMKKTEEVYKDQIKEQENKTHSNWVNARNAERALNQEKLESSKLREKLAVLTSQLNERRAPLFRPNSGQPAGPRQGDSYGPSPVSGGAPSPPIMIEGPRRPPSAPVGRRIDPYGPRPPSDPHGRYAENKHISGMDMMGPRSSSPANMDTSAVDPQIKAEVAEAEASTESPEPGPGSFLASPIRDSPGPLVPPGPHDPMLPPPHIRLPPPGPYRGPRPGPYHLPPGPLPPNVAPPLHGPPHPANGYPGMPLHAPMGGDFGPRPANGHAFHPRPGPPHAMDPRGLPPPHFRPPPPHHYGPMPPPHDLRGPGGLRPPVPPDPRFPGQRDHSGPPMDLPPGVPPHPGHPGDVYGQANALQNSAGAHSGPAQDLHVKQEAPQDSARPAMAKP